MRCHKTKHIAVEPATEYSHRISSRQNKTRRFASALDTPSKRDYTEAALSYAGRSSSGIVLINLAQDRRRSVIASDSPAGRARIPAPRRADRAAGGGAIDPWSTVQSAQRVALAACQPASSSPRIRVRHTAGKQPVPPNRITRHRRPRPVDRPVRPCRGFRKHRGWLSACRNRRSFRREVAEPSGILAPEFGEVSAKRRRPDSNRGMVDLQSTALIHLATAPTLRMPASYTELPDATSQTSWRRWSRGWSSGVVERWDAGTPSPYSPIVRQSNTPIFHHSNAPLFKGGSTRCRPGLSGLDACSCEGRTEAWPH